MAKQHLQHIKSATINKAPAQNDLLYGEIAINYAKGSEKIYIKNTNNEIVPFYCGTDVDDKINEKKLLTNVTYSELKSLMDNSGLTPGMFYRITDYVTGITLSQNASAMHQFDIIVMALNESEISEDAYAARHSSGSNDYFANCNLSAWKLKYAVKDIEGRFEWAKGAQGGTTVIKGVIYYMRDEFGNEAPYDFKNIQFLRNVYNGNVDDINGTAEMLYTFSWIDDNGDVYDASVMAGSLDGITESGIEHKNFVAMNKIEPAYKRIEVGSNKAIPLMVLNNNVFVSSATFDNGIFYGISGNTFAENSVDNTFGNGCNNNNIGSDCKNNVFGHMCTNNVIEHNSESISFSDGYCNNCKIGSGNKGIAITSTPQADSTLVLNNITVASNVNNDISNPITITHDLGAYDEGATYIRSTIPVISAN